MAANSLEVTTVAATRSAWRHHVISRAQTKSLAVRLFPLSDTENPEVGEVIKRSDE